MIFEPRLMLYQKVTIDSTLQPVVNGDYQIRGLGHHGMISGARDSGATTSVKAWLSPEGGFTEIPVGSPLTP